jgi:hypothetical protein
VSGRAAAAPSERDRSKTDTCGTSDQDGHVGDCLLLCLEAEEAKEARRSTSVLCCMCWYGWSRPGSGQLVGAPNPVSLSASFLALPRPLPLNLSAICRYVAYAMAACCPPGTPGFVKPDEHAALRGTVIHHERIECYVVRPEHAPKGAIVLVPEVFGIHCGRLKEIADALANHAYEVFV